MTINHAQFRLQVDRLVDTFGERAFSDQRETMIWEMVQGLDYDFVIAIVDSFIRGAKQAPLPADFSEAIAKAEKHGAKLYRLGENRPKEIARCRSCADSGFARVVRKDGADAWAKWSHGSAPCHCARGRELIEAGRRMRPSPFDLGGQYGDHWTKSYRIISPWTGGGEGA